MGYALRQAHLRVVPPVDAPSTSSAADGLDFSPLRTRQEAENLFIIDAVQTGESAVWEAYFVESLVEFMVHARRPTGVVSDSDAEWLGGLIGTDPSPSVPALLRALVAEAEVIPPVLMGYALACGAVRV